MASAQQIQIIDTAFLVGKRRPLAEFCPRWKQLIIRAIYFLLGWDDGAAVEVQAICTDRELAKDMASRWPAGFFIRLPINTPLPDEPCQFREHEFPNSDAAKSYERLHGAPLAAVSPSDIRALKKLDQQMGELVKKVRTG